MPALSRSGPRIAPKRRNAPFGFASLTLTEDEVARSSGRRSGVVNEGGQRFDESITACSLPKTNWTCRRSSQPERICRDASPWPTNRLCVRPWTLEGRSLVRGILVGISGLEPLTTAISARPGPSFEQDQQCAESPFKTYLTRDFSLDQLSRSLL